MSTHTLSTSSMKATWVAMLAIRDPCLHAETRCAGISTWNAHTNIVAIIELVERVCVDMFIAINNRFPVGSRRRTSGITFDGSHYATETLVDGWGCRMVFTAEATTA